MKTGAQDVDLILVRINSIAVPIADVFAGLLDGRGAPMQERVANLKQQPNSVLDVGDTRSILLHAVYDALVHFAVHTKESIERDGIVNKPKPARRLPSGRDILQTSEHPETTL